MYCSKCGSQISENTKYCIRCGAIQGEEFQPSNVSVTEQPVINEQVITSQPTEDNHLADVLCTISLGLYFVVPCILTYIYEIFSKAPFIVLSLGILSLLSVLAAYVLMIIARIKCPKSVYAKVVMWIYIVLLVMSLLIGAIFIAACGACMNARS